MKRQIFFVFLLVLCLGLMAQQADWYDMKFEKGAGTLIIKNYSFDQIWETMIKTLLMNKYKISVIEKESKIISAYKDPVASYNHRIQIVFIENEGSINLMTTTEPLRKMEGLEGFAQQIGGNKAHKKLEKKLFEKLIANLSK